MPPSLAEVQVASDRKLLRRQPKLLGRKWSRMAASPFAFLRGASALWAEVLKRQPRLLHGFAGRGVLVGDLHLENFGTFHTHQGVAFHVNDFDEAFVGPWAFDVLRLLTSVLLARGELHVTGFQVLALAEALLEGHARGVAGERQSPPPFVLALLAEAERASPEKLFKRKLESKTRLRCEPEKTMPAPPSLVKLVPAALAHWALDRPHPMADVRGLEVLDVVRRVAGTGSLGVERLLVLCALRDGSPLLVELKEARGSPTDPLATDPARLVELMSRGLPFIPRDVGHAHLGPVGVIVHPLAPGEGKLEEQDLPPDALEPVLHYLGFLTGQVHRNGADEKARWTGAQARQLVDRASDLAGQHAHAFLDFCRLVHDAAPR